GADALGSGRTGDRHARAIIRSTGRLRSQAGAVGAVPARHGGPALTSTGRGARLGGPASGDRTAAATRRRVGVSPPRTHRDGSRNAAAAPRAGARPFAQSGSA